MRKRKCILLTGMVLSLIHLYGQEVKPMAEGKVSYITTQNIYVKFEQTGTVQPGDTIFIRKEEKLIPLFIAESVSSTSAVGKPMGPFELKISDVVFAKSRIPEKKSKGQVSERIPTIISSKQQDTVQTARKVVIANPETVQKIRGRLAASSYSSFSNSSAFNQRMRYTFSMTADHISESKFSTDTYILFTHKVNHWAEVKDNIFSALKVYSLSVKYDLNPQTHFLLGRNINPRIVSVGAIDGFQGETSVKNFTFGAVVGTNPDYADYRFNPKLFEYGAYVSHDYKNNTGNLGTSFAYFEQTNSGKIDRRFVYFQHENSLIKNINWFSSIELDLYALKNGTPTNTVSLTSLYLSLQYRISRKLSVFGSYDARKNVIYYETFKSYLDQMLEDATRQGYQFRVNYRPANFISSGISGGYRFQKKDIHPMLNVNGFLTFSQVPWIKSSVSLTANWLQSSYVNGMIYGIRFDRDIVPSKLSSSIAYRLVDNTYPNSNMSMVQHMATLELSWQMSRKTYLSVNYDGTFDKTNKYQSIYISLNQRF